MSTTRRSRTLTIAKRWTSNIEKTAQRQDDFVFAEAPDDGRRLRHEFEFHVDNTKLVRSWAGVLAKGSRAKAGFSILHAGRVIKGWPDAWRPQEVYGQIQGPNDLVNQRLVGEVELDAFGVSHTKDDILWFGDGEQAVEAQLKTHISDLIDAATSLRRPLPAAPTPSQSSRVPGSSLLVNARGQPYDRFGVDAMMDRLQHGVGFRVHAHGFRHTFGTVATKLGWNFEHLRAAMGHADYATLQRYVRLSTERDLGPLKEWAEFRRR